MKKISVAVLLLSLLTACGGSDSEPDPFEMLSGSWQELVDDSLSKYHIFFDKIGNRRDFIYHGDTGCYTEHMGMIFPRTEHVKDNQFILVSRSGRYSKLYYTVSIDGNYLNKGPYFPRDYLKSNLTIDYFVNQLCD